MVIRSRTPGTASWSPPWASSLWTSSADQSSWIRMWSFLLLVSVLLSARELRVAEAVTIQSSAALGAPTGYNYDNIRELYEMILSQNEPMEEGSASERAQVYPMIPAEYSGHVMERKGGITLVPRGLRLRFGKRGSFGHLTSDEASEDESGDEGIKSFGPGNGLRMRFGKRSIPDLKMRFGKKKSSQSYAPSLRFGKKSNYAPSLRFGKRGEAFGPTLRFGKKSDDEIDSDLDALFGHGGLRMRFGKKDGTNGHTLNLRFGKKSGDGFGEDYFSARMNPKLRFGKRSVNDGQSGDKKVSKIAGHEVVMDNQRL